MTLRREGPTHRAASLTRRPAAKSKITSGGFSERREKRPAWNCRLDCSTNDHAVTCPLTLRGFICRQIANVGAVLGAKYNFTKPASLLQGSIRPIELKRMATKGLFQVNRVPYFTFPKDVLRVTDQLDCGRDCQMRREVATSIRSLGKGEDSCKKKTLVPYFLAPGDFL